MHSAYSNFIAVLPNRFLHTVVNSSQYLSSRIPRIFVTVSNQFRYCFEEHHELVEKIIILHESQYFSILGEIGALGRKSLYLDQKIVNHVILVAKTANQD